MKYGCRDDHSKFHDILPMPKCGLMDWRIRCKTIEQPMKLPAMSNRTAKTESQPKRARRRFMEQMEIRDGHWIWHGRIDRGTCTFHDGYIQTSARRWAWMHIARRKLSESQRLVGRCGVQSCVCPECAIVSEGNRQGRGKEWKRV
jgi:hypothetical protein